jgi:tetratricopeptide (TPR) repeat protein
MADGNAIERYEAFLQEDPDNTLLRLNLGDLYHRAGQFGRAEACFSACLDDDSLRSVAKGHLGKLRLSQSRLEEAERLFKEILASGDEDPALLHNLGIALYFQRRWPEAQEAFESASRKGLGSGANLRYLAFSLHHQNKAAEARELAQRWLDAALSDEAMGYVSLLELDLGHREAAEQRADEALRLNPDNVDATYVKSVGLIERQEMDKAERLLARVLEKQPQSFRALQGLGMVHYYRQEFDTAIQFLERALKVVPRQVGTIITIGWAHLAKKDVFNAERAFRRAIAAEPNFGEAHGGLATALALQRREKEARDEITIARRLDRKGFGAVYAQSILLALQGRTDAAEQLVNRALEQPLSPGAPTIAESIATYVKKQGLGPPQDDKPNGPR